MGRGVENDQALNSLNLEEHMHRTLKGIFTLAIVATAAACDAGSPTESSFVSPPEAPMQAKPGAGSQGQLSFSYTQSQSSETSQGSLGGLGRIDFSGSLTTGTPCVNVTASHSATTNTVTVTVSAASNGSACIQVVTFNNYQGAVSGLTAGTYTFTVIHDLGGSRTTAHTNTVTVL
jgi:hypothetical protein